MFSLLDFSACPIFCDSPDGKQLDTTIPSRYWNCIAPSLIKIAMQMFVCVFLYVIGCIHSLSSVSIFRKMMSKTAHFKTSSTPVFSNLNTVLCKIFKILNLKTVVFRFCVGYDELTKCCEVS